MKIKKYNFEKIERKWQKKWEKWNLYKTEDFSSKPKYYCLIEFPYPSGEGLHVGHLRSYTAMDILSRLKRMQGYNVLYPIGWDAFGLPAENYALKTGIHPKITTKKNIAVFKRQLKSLGYSFDWSREINTTDPAYYKWTQWIFLKLFEKGLAYKAEMPINFCTSCKVGLANEEVVNGVCERCGGEVIKKVKKQWMLKITAYADRLLEDLNSVDYLEKIKIQQKNWIGKSYGLEEEWKVEGMDLKLKTFTTSPHTSWGATFMVIAPEHPLIQKMVEGTEYEKGAKIFCQRIIEEKIKNPLNAEKKKEGFFLGRHIINHLNGKRMPLYIANFAIYDYGTGIVKCTPAHDQRDFEFAKQYNLEIVPVVSLYQNKSLKAEEMSEAYTGQGIMINAERFNGMPSEKAHQAVGEYIVKQNNGQWAVNYKLRDWIFSRQRYWGEPIPIIECPKCGFVPLDEKDLPLVLPKIRKYRVLETGESPLANLKKWVEVVCPKCQSPAKRETDTMPQWAGSSWYFLRYIDPQNDQALANAEKLKYWLPVDWYNGGMEHTTLHLLYSRFWHKFLYDLKVVPLSEPYQKRTSHGMILGEGGEKMSKTKGNVVNPDEIINQYGADTLRVYEMFMGPFDQAIPWDAKGVIGVRRFLDRIWDLGKKVKLEEKEEKDLIRLIHQTIKKVTDDILEFHFNTAVSALMVLTNRMGKVEYLSKQSYEYLIILLSLFAPHLSEEIWQCLGNKESIFKEGWLKYDAHLLKEDKCALIIQINGKVRDKVIVSIDLSQKEIEKIVLEREKVKKWLEKKKVFKFIFIPHKLINLVV